MPVRAGGAPATSGWRPQRTQRSLPALANGWGGSNSTVSPIISTLVPTVRRSRYAASMRNFAGIYG